MKKPFPSPSIILAFFLGILVVSSRLVFGFTEPTQTPPLNNTPAPLNVGSTGQSKAGGLILNTGGAINGLIVQSGNVGIGTVSPGEKLDVSGNVRATAFYYSSDERLKTDIHRIQNALEKVRKLEGVYFKWKESDARHIGLIAQNIEEVFPEAVATDPHTGYKSVQYGNLVASLIEAVKELDGEVSALRLQNLALEKKIDELQRALSELQNK